MRGPQGPNRYAIMHTISYRENLYRDISAYRVYRTTLIQSSAELEVIQ